MDAAALIAPAAVAVAALAGGVGLRVEHRRRGALLALAREQGWEVARRDDAWTTAFEGEPFGRGHDRRAETVLTGTYGGRDLVAFDYSCRTRTTDGSGAVSVQQHRWAVAALRLPATVPLVEVAPSWLPRLLGRGLELESEDFNRRYRVRTEAPRLAYDVLAPRTVQLLLDRPDVAFRLHGGVVVSWSRGRLEPDGLLERLQTLTALLDAVPAWVWADHA